MDIKSLRICFKDELDRIILEGKLTSLPLKEEFIISKSIEFFNDPEPCMIHRSAVMKRIFMEIGEYIIQNVKQGKHEVLWEEVTDLFRKAVNLEEKVKYISFFI